MLGRKKVQMTPINYERKKEQKKKILCSDTKKNEVELIMIVLILFVVNFPEKNPKTNK